MPKIQAENFRRKIPAENLGGKFLRKILRENSGASQNLGGYTEFMRLVKIYAPGSWIWTATVIMYEFSVQ